ncbi:hypothetical protein [Actinacidiphila sp. ITFR-21]|uniref:hypothetical protein n=1 Tax=Actinacidiphila sp. ITFR-21 TaxID=3075199 RepID=UPI002889720A|nr:hypothetical protein [Streptomyces sp. ITFR-21]WNI17602.1 hypothetical protein RLT57_20145 [Streptomyces sp. ITFR-21]WNI17742.1 hypothetical protein RLT57_20860 [Streptomyces sp. ITFR-21]
MIGGDLDDAPVPPGVYVVWEELLGVPGGRYTPQRFARRQRWHRPAAALGLYETNPKAVQALWGLWEDDRPVTVVTYLPRDVAAHLPRRLERECVPHARFLVDQPVHMSRTIALLADVARIVHSVPAHAFLYGPKGFLVPPQSPELIREVL